MKRLDFMPGFATAQDPLNVLLALSRIRIPRFAHPQILLTRRFLVAAVRPR